MLAAALAYYTVFSIAPLLVIAIAIAGFFFGADAAQGQIVTQLQSLMGKEGAEAVQSLLQSTNKSQGGTIATILGIVTLLFGASGVFAQLQDALNFMWEVKPKKKPGVKGILSLVQSRFLSFAMVLVIGFLLLVSLVISTSLEGVSNYFGNLFPGLVIIGQLLNLVISYSAITLLFALIYRVLPDIKVFWKDVMPGALLAALLFTVGKYLLGLYLSHSGVSSAYGAAGSLVVILIWVYYSAQILLFGAEFTQVYAKAHGSKNALAEGIEDTELESASKDISSSS